MNYGKHMYVEVDILCVRSSRLVSFYSPTNIPSFTTPFDHSHPSAILRNKSFSLLHISVFNQQDEQDLNIGVLSKLLISHCQTMLGDVNHFQMMVQFPSHTSKTSRIKCVLFIQRLILNHCNTPCSSRVEMFIAQKRRQLVTMPKFLQS